MTTVGLMTSWSTSKAVYANVQDSSFNSIFMRVNPKDQDATPGTGLIVAPYANPGTGTSYSGYIGTNQLLRYTVAKVTNGSVSQLFAGKQGTNFFLEMTPLNPDTLFDITIDQSTDSIQVTPYGIYMKGTDGILYRRDLRGSGSIFGESIRPTNLGGAGAVNGDPGTYKSWACYYGKGEDTFAFISYRNQVCLRYDPAFLPQPVNIASAAPATNSYNANSLIYHPKQNRLYFTGTIVLAGQHRVISYNIQDSTVTISASSNPLTYASPMCVFKNGVICLGADDKIYSIPSPGGWQLLHDLPLITGGAFGFRYLASDNRNIFVNGITPDGDSVLYQIDVNNAVTKYTTVAGSITYDPNYLIIGQII